MSGHSHWAGIKHKKAAQDAKRGKIFSKLGKLISVAAREKGGDPSMNPRLRIAIETAQKANMPKENIERAVKKGAGEDGSEKLEEVTLEAYGPDGVAILIEVITDNKNRTLGDIKGVLSKHNGKLASEGSVKWMFSQKGSITVDVANLDKESAELKAIDAGAENIEWQGDELIVYTNLENTEDAKQKLTDYGLPVQSSSVQWVPQNPIKIDERQKEKLNRFFEALDDYDDVQEIYSNIAF